MKKKKIAIICPADYPVPATKGGAIETLIEIFIKENEIYKECDITVYSYFEKEALIESIKYRNSEFVFLKINPLINPLNNLLIRIVRKILKKRVNTLFISKITKDIKKKNIKDIIVEGNKGYVLPIRQNIKDSRIYLHIHHPAFSDKNINNQEIVEKCKNVLTVSDYIKNKVLDNINIDNNKVITLKNCTNTGLFNKKLYMQYREELRNKYNINMNEIVILFSGRILGIKGIKELILAFKKYCFQLDVKLLIVGNSGFGKNTKSEYDEELIEISKDINEKIIFTGFIHNSEIPKIHALADIAVVPSIWDDPAPLVVIEAMSSGLPLIVTDSGGIPEYVNDDCAIIVERDEEIVDHLGKALVQLIRNKELREKMGKLARSQAEKFSTTNYYYDFVKILKQDWNEINEN